MAACSVLIAYKLEKAITGVLAQNLLRLSPAQLNELASGLDALPMDLALVLPSIRKLSRNDLLSVAQVAKSREELIEQLSNKFQRCSRTKGLAGNRRWLWRFCQKGS